jgi:hypothetical protein
MSAVTVVTDLEICNMALDFVKETPITSLDEDRTAARWMKRNYKPVRNIVLTTIPWKFAMKRAMLPEDPEKPAFEWDKRFRKPNDCMRVLHLRYQGRMNGALIPHQVEGDFILTNAGAPLPIRYISLIDDVARWTPMFCDAVAYKLAARIAHLLTGKQSMVEMNNVMFRETLTLAASIDAAEGSVAVQYATTYDLARHSGSDMYADNEW